MTYGILRPGARSLRATILLLSLSTTWIATAQTDDSNSMTGSAIAAATLAPKVLPARLLECEGNGPCNGAWTLDGSNGTAIWFAQSPTRAKLTVVSSDPEDIVIRRTNISDGNSAVYHGRRQGDEYAGTVVWSKPDHPGFASGRWSASVPQVTCDADSRMLPDDAKRVGQTALMFDSWRGAFDCYIVAADAGDVQAQMVVGLIFYNGRKGDVPQDYAKALPWLRKAADAGVYGAQVKVSDMYTLGQGTPKDPELAAFYGKKAAEQRRDHERQEDRQDRAADRTANAMTGFVMGAVFGALFF